MSTERPILFSGPLVRAILDGRKTVTRRLQGLDAINLHVPGFAYRRRADTTPAPDSWRHVGAHRRDPSVHLWMPKGYTGADAAACPTLRCPSGAGGDTLWVRETWGLAGDVPIYRAEAPVGREDTVRELLDDGRWRPSIHMPREFARLFLEVTDVRPERLQAITREDILAEGVGIPALSTELLREAWVDIWDSIYGAKPGQSWADNPWVWRVAFRVREVRR